MIQPFLPLPLEPGDVVQFTDPGPIWGERKVKGIVTAVYSDTFDRHVLAVVKWKTGHELPTFEAALERTK